MDREFAWDSLVGTGVFQLLSGILDGFPSSCLRALKHGKTKSSFQAAYAGGLALWWSNDVKLSVLNHDKNFIDTVISINGEDVWFGTFIYAPPYEEEKQEFWERLGSLRNDVNAKWCIMGDTNIVASPNEKFGGLRFDFNSAKWFHEFLDRSYLMEIHSKGGAYTWSNQRCEEDEICEKLDRVLSSSEWSFLFPKAIALIEVPIASDHAPIVLLTNGVKKKARTEFKFESRWTLEDECSTIIQEEWVPTEQRSHRGTFRNSKLTGRMAG
ncbi:hypothetical protein V6N11_072867 [Hibiscus sabdariffa]|uniref:Endonuclease/exonuclease/phosphatase domain-containing protein n=1 Tax=Hibiscus sabdariffa TaxID=183260 RepID=A0ABR1ZBW5_9ROSI